jgi:hypothetical protein
MRSNLENNLAYKLRLQSTQHEITRFNLVGPFVIPPDGSEFQFLDPGASARTVFLPAISPGGGQFFMICNLSLTQDLNVVDSFGVAVATVQETQSMIFVSSRTAWSFLAALTAAQIALLTSIGPIFTQISAFTRQTVVGAAAVIAPTDIEVWVNFAGAVTLTMPDAAAWLAAHPFGNLFIKDISGAASSNNILINRVGTDLMDGASSVSITSDFGGFALRVSAANKWSLE